MTNIIQSILAINPKAEVVVRGNDITQIDWLETQQLLIKNTGIKNYLQSQL